MKKELKKRICPYSGEEFIPKRTNHIYACEENRIAFNNDKNNDKRKKLAPINKMLYQDYDVVNTVLGNRKEASIHSEYLRGAGLSFKVFNHIELDYKTREWHYALYDITIIQSKENPKIYKLRRND